MNQGELLLEHLCISHDIKLPLNELNKQRKDYKKMTIEDLKAALDNIPNKGAINKARRLQIQKQIFELMNKGDRA